MSSQWEYKTLKLSTDYVFWTGTDFNADSLSDMLNRNGQDGWELVSIFDIARRDGGGSKFVVAVMKRLKS